MNKILIIGGGFGGVAAAKKLCHSGLFIDGILIDKKLSSDFLPTLPDCLGRGIPPECLSYPLNDFCQRNGFQFVNDEVTAVDLEKKEVMTKNSVLNYDYLVIASGSETNFYGNDNIRSNALKLDDCVDAEKMIGILNQRDVDHFIIGGGGYTGIEVATNLRMFLDKKHRSGKIIIVERAASILGALPAWMKDYTAENLKRLDVEVFINNSIGNIDGRKVTLADGKVFDSALVIWAAGVKTAGFINDLKVEKNPQGRIKVDDFLRLNDRCFAVGDAGYFVYKDVSLRMAVQFAIVQGQCAADNIIRTIKGQKLRPYQPRDLGFIIPMANNKSCGTIFGFDLKGILPTLFHFFMCLYRSQTWKNRFCLAKAFIKPGK
ncbi:MAG: FAD-dependent oxidoreductase [Candidatus Omnitrophica bacterium]|nr:FAD-dependent oxidoreductase [Candidatus Omnitrophota bacterium]